MGIMSAGSCSRTVHFCARQEHHVFFVNACQQLRADPQVMDSPKAAGRADDIVNKFACCRGPEGHILQK